VKVLILNYYSVEFKIRKYVLFVESGMWNMDYWEKLLGYRQ
jgi:hypothetical protein